jgi:hypothetical protein
VGYHCFLSLRSKPLNNFVFDQSDLRLWQRARHASRPRAATVSKGIFCINSVVRSIQALTPALIKNVELKSWIRREEFRYFFQPLPER